MTAAALAREYHEKPAALGGVSGKAGRALVASIEPTRERAVSTLRAPIPDADVRPARPAIQ